MVSTRSMFDSNLIDLIVELRRTNLWEALLQKRNKLYRRFDGTEIIGSTSTVVEIVVVGDWYLGKRKTGIRFVLMVNKQGQTRLA